MMKELLLRTGTCSRSGLHELQSATSYLWNGWYDEFRSEPERLCSDHSILHNILDDTRSVYVHLKTEDGHAAACSSQVFVCKVLRLRLQLSYPFGSEFFLSLHYGSSVGWRN